jgi:hypothetical protein
MRNILVNGIPALDDPELVPEAENEPQPDTQPESESESEPEPESRTQFPATTSQRVHSPTRRKFPNKPRRRKTGKSGRHGKYAQWSLHTELEYLLDKDIDVADHRWGFIICFDSKTFHQGIAKLDEHKQQLINDKYTQAKLEWKCNGCSEHTVEKAKQFVQCDQCDKWYHGICSGIDLNETDVENIAWSCQNCIDET